MTSHHMPRPPEPGGFPWYDHMLASVAIVSSEKKSNIPHSLRIVFASRWRPSRFVQGRPGEVRANLKSESMAHTTSCSEVETRPVRRERWNYFTSASEKQLPPTFAVQATYNTSHVEAGWALRQFGRTCMGSNVEGRQ